MLIKNIILIFIGLCGGFTIAGGVFAFLIVIGVINRLITRTKTAKYILLYEDLIILGGIIGNLITVFNLSVPVGYTGIFIYGMFSGVFIGCLAMALAEVLKVLPIFTARIKLVQGMPFIVLAIALGKAFGAFFQLYFKN
jgi:hypothetical protein